MYPANHDSTPPFFSRAQKAGLLNRDHPVSIPVVHVEQHLYQLDIFFLARCNEMIRYASVWSAPTRYRGMSFWWSVSRSPQSNHLAQPGLDRPRRQQCRHPP